MTPDGSAAWTFTTAVWTRPEPGPHSCALGTGTPMTSGAHPRFVNVGPSESGVGLGVGFEVGVGVGVGLDVGVGVAFGVGAAVAFEVGVGVCVRVRGGEDVGVGLAAPSGWPTGVDPGEAANVSGALESAALVGDTVALPGSDDLLGVYVPLAHGSLGRHPGTVGVGEINGVGRNATGSAHFPN